MINSYKIIGKDPALKTILKNVKIVAPTNVHVLICGETGTGKELIANAIHTQSTRAANLLITLNCAALPEDLIESELFGYLQGAFTGAETDKPGIIAAADGSTLFLDEINSLSLSIQAKLLRLMESGEYFPVGSVKLAKANVRIIAASNCDLQKLVDTGRFRQDLYFRLNVFPLQLPALRMRKNDIEILLSYYLHFYSKKYGVVTTILSPTALSVLREYAWPGNIRELKNLCENLTIQRLRRPIVPGDLPTVCNKIDKNQSENDFLLPDEGISWQELEDSLVRQAMEKSGGKYSKAAKLLGISRHALYYKVKKTQKFNTPPSLYLATPLPMSLS